jgi:GTP:adenosylcobinamide-phosphate guanylyltransferase
MYSFEIVGTKAAELAALLKNKNVFYVNIEIPNSKSSTIETVIEDLNGITCSVEADIITFKGNGKSAYFTILETAQILTHKTEDCEIVSTFAENGGLQIKKSKEQLTKDS